jgi:hypothetical protein
MAQELITEAQAVHLPWSYKIWLTTLLRPSIRNYTALAQRPSMSAWRAYLWVFAGGVIGGAIDSARPLIVRLAEHHDIDTLLVALIPVSSLIAVCNLAAFAWCAQRVAHVFKGSGTYRQLVTLCASFSAPLLVAASILDLLPLTRVLLVGLYLYWLALYVVAVHAVSGLARLKALLTIVVALVMLGCVWLGIVFLVGYSGLLLP